MSLQQSSLSPQKRGDSQNLAANHHSPSKNIIEYYSVQLRILESKCDQKEKELASWKNRCSLLEQELNASTAQSSHAQESAFVLEKQFTNSQQALAQSKAEQGHTLNELERAHKIIIDLEQVVTAQNLQLKSDEEKIYELQRTLRATEQQRVAQLEERDILQRQNVEAVKQEGAVAQAKLQSEIETQNAQLQKALSKIVELENLLTRSQIVEKQQQADNLRTQEAIVELRRTLAEGNFSQQRERELLQQRFDDELARKRQSFEIERQKLIANIESLKAELLELKRINDLKEQNNISLSKHLLEAERLLQLEQNEKDVLRRQIELQAIEKQNEGHRSRWQIEEAVRQDQLRKEELFRRNTAATSAVQKELRDVELERLRQEERELKRLLEGGNDYQQQTTTTSAQKATSATVQRSSISPVARASAIEVQRGSVSPTLKGVSFSPVRSEFRY